MKDSKLEPSTMTYDICRRYINDLSGCIDEAMIRTLNGWCRSRSFMKLVDATSLFDAQLHGINEYRALMQIAAFFKKNKAFVNEEVCLKAALSSFLEAEEQCFLTNRRLDDLYVDRDLINPDINLKIFRMEQYIRTVLGSFTPFISRLPEYIRVTAGATATRSRKESRPHMKISPRMVSTPRAEPYLDALSRFFGYGGVKARKILWNRVEFVPKNWKTHRTIACEPEGNIPLQLAFDSYAKDRLRSFGIDLSDQSRNQGLAKLGSTDGSLATVDLSAASDTISYNVVAWLFPQPWFRFLCDIRSEYYRIEDPDSPSGLAYKKYEKFSSMGNGSTFPIETLIFAAAAAACGSKKFSVYGDDIIIESELFGELEELLHFFGFRLNRDKSFNTGPFRESCGGNYYEGIDVTPFYLRDIDNRQTILSHNVNGLASISLPEGEVWAFLRSLVKEKDLLLVPHNWDTTSGIHIDIPTSYKEGLIHTKRKRFRDIHVYRGYIQKNVTYDTPDSRSLFLWFLDKFRIKSDVDIVRGRDSLRHKYVRKWVRWYPPTTGTPVHLYWWTDYITHS